MGGVSSREKTVYRYPCATAQLAFDSTTAPPQSASSSSVMTETTHTVGCVRRCGIHSRAPPATPLLALSECQSAISRALRARAQRARALRQLSAPPSASSGVKFQRTIASIPPLTTHYCTQNANRPSAPPPKVFECVCHLDHSSNKQAPRMSPQGNPDHDRAPPLPSVHAWPLTVLRRPAPSCSSPAARGWCVHAASRRGPCDSASGRRRGSRTPCCSPGACR